MITPAPSDPLEEKIKLLQHQTSTLLLLGSVNLFLNIATICIGFLIAWS